MNDPEDNPRLEENDRIGSLVRSAGARAVPCKERQARARQTVYAEWRSANALRRHAKWLSVAAALACAAVLLWGVQARMQGAAVHVATVTRVTGEVLVHSGQKSDATLLRDAKALFTGDSLDSSAGGRALLHWLRNAQVQMDSDSTVLLKSPSELELLRGAAYIETSGGGGRLADITVITSAGRVRHIGTQFEVRIADGGNLRVRVRDGSAVFIGSWTNKVTVRAGQQLLVSGRKVTLSPGPSVTDPSWAWTREIETPAAGRTLFEVLETLSRDSGIRIVYETAEAQDKAREIRLHGRLDGLPVQDALRAALAGSGLEYVTHADRVEIRIPRPP